MKITRYYNILICNILIILFCSCGKETSESGIAVNTGNVDFSGNNRQDLSYSQTKSTSEQLNIKGLTKIRWDDRGGYEKENTNVIFVDCGYYTPDTEDLTGATCSFNNGKWFLLEPKIEPYDNLIENGDFEDWKNGFGPFTKHLEVSATSYTIWSNNLASSFVEAVTNEGFTDTIAMHIKGEIAVLQQLKKDIVLKISGKKLTVSLNVDIKESLGSGIVFMCDTLHDGRKEILLNLEKGQRKVNTTINIPKDTENISITIFSRASVNDIYIDDFKLINGIMPFL